MGTASNGESGLNLQDELDLYVKKIYEIGIKQGYRAGYEDGFVDGENTGRQKERASSTQAVSDGLRAGSSECGKKMNDYKK